MKKYIFSFFAITIIILTAIQAQIPTNGLVAYYPFSGNANDSSGNSNNGTVSNATLTTDRFGRANNAYSFNGTSSNKIVVQNSPSLEIQTGGLTISQWIYFTSAGSLYQTISKDIDINTGYFGTRFYNNSDGTYRYDFQINKNATQNGELVDTVSSGGLLINQWYLFTATYDFSNLKVYINGKLVGKLKSSNPLYISSSPLTIGSSGISYYLNGKLDDIAIYNRALDSAEIQAIYHAGGYGIINTSISSFTPSSASKGNTVTLKGVSFSGTTSVTFGGTTASSFKVVNDSTITAIVGNGTSGNIVVISPNGTSSLGGFVFNNTGIPTNGLVAWYPFSGNSLDSSGNGNNGTVNGATLTTDRFGRANSAYSFNGSSNEIIVSNASSLNLLPISISAWFKTSSVQQNGMIVNKYGCQSYNGYSLNLNTGHPSGYYFGSDYSGIDLDNTKTSLSSFNLNDNKWHHSLITIDSNKLKYYIDGIIVDSTPFNGIGAKTNTSEDLHFGHYAQGVCYANQNYYYEGYIDDIRIYNRNLVNTEVQSLYHEGGYSLPVTIDNIKASQKDNLVDVVWRTTTEVNTNNFNIQHSNNSENFKDIGNVKAIGSGANSYQFTDNNPANGINYYRLQSVDKDGSSSFSKVVSVNFGDKQSFSIVPNPARDFATISFSKTIDKVTIAVYDITGKAVITQSLNGSSNTYKLNTQSLKSGLYVIKVNTATGNYNEKLLINK